MNISIVNCEVNVSHEFLTEEFWNTASINEVYRAIGITIGTIMLFFFLLGVPGNGLIIFSIIRNRLYEQPTLLLLLNLALVDFMTSIIILPPIIITGIAGEYIFGGSDYIRCKVCELGLFIVLFSLANIFTLALLSVDRLILIRIPLKYHKIMTLKLTVFLVLLIWITLIFLSIFPSVFNIGSMYYDHPTFACLPQYDGSSQVTLNIYYGLVLFLVGVIAFIIIVIANAWIIAIARRNIKQIYSVQNDVKKQLQYSDSVRDVFKNKKNRKQLQLLRVFGLILISNIITWIPSLIRIIEASIRPSDQSLWSNFILIVSINSHCIIHPFIQAGLIPEIRRYFLLPSKFCSLCCRTRAVTTMKYRLKKICRFDTFRKYLEILNMTLLDPSDTMLPQKDIGLPLSATALPPSDTLPPPNNAAQSTNDNTTKSTK